MAEFVFFKPRFFVFLESFLSRAKVSSAYLLVIFSCFYFYFHIMVVTAEKVIDQVVQSMQGCKVLFSV